MCQHALQISDIGIASAHVAEVACMRLLVLITTAVRRDDGTVAGREAVHDWARTHPEVVQPVMIVVSMQCVTSHGLSGVS